MYTFKNQMKDLISKYGKDKITPELCNEVWQKFKTKTNKDLESILTHIMSHKPTYGAKFSIQDFLNTNDRHKSYTNEKPVRQAHRPAKKKRETTFLKHHLKCLGVKSVYEAMLKIKNSK